MDGVLADVETVFLNRYELETGTCLTRKDVEGKTEREAYPNVREWVTTEGFFRNLPVMSDSQDIMAALYDKYDVFIVSAATEFPLSMKEKIEWLNAHFPFITWQKMVFCGSKAIAKADILIDDHFKNLDVFEGDTLLFHAAHNALKPDGRHRRVYSWEEIGRILL
jgi:5'(3')-deoxyribonucleotidase